MPGVSGREVAEAVCGGYDPQTKVLLFRITDDAVVCHASSSAEEAVPHESRSPAGTGRKVRRCSGIA